MSLVQKINEILRFTQGKSPGTTVDFLYLSNYIDDKTHIKLRIISSSIEMFGDNQHILFVNLVYKIINDIKSKTK